MMDRVLERDGFFTFSGTSSSIYDYQCFDDQASKVWLTGKEFKENEEHWIAAQKKIWHFFNRPYNYGHHIGREQRQKIEARQEVIEAKEGELFLAKIVKYLLLLASLITFIFDSSNGSWGFLGVIGTFILITLIKEMDLKNAFSKAMQEKDRYEQELNHLLDQQQGILNEIIEPKEILRVLWKKLEALELGLYSSYFPEDAGKVRSGLVDFYNSLNDDLDATRQLDDHPNHPLVLSWGLLQPPSRSFSDNRQATGIKAASKDLREKIATFRKLADGTPIYRLFYIQFLFFRDKNLNVVSLCYDFLTDKQYNISVDTYQYNHITGTSYSEEDISHMPKQAFFEEFDLDLPEELLENVYGSQVKVISFSSTSGTSFRCVLPDIKVTDGLEDWLQYKRQLLVANDINAGGEERDYRDILGQETAQNEVLTKLADHSVKLLWKCCDESTGLSEHKYLKDLKEERGKQRKGRPPFAGVSQPRPPHVS